MSTEGKIYDRVSFTWREPEEMARIQAEREARVRAKENYDGPLAPMVASDATEVQSQVNGRVYTSKAALRDHYRREGVIEVGNDVPKTRIHNEGWKEPNAKEKRRAALGKAFSRYGII